jgi:membrane dipeptidase
MLAGGVTAKVYQILVDVEIGADFRASADKREGWKRKALESIQQVHETIAADPKRLMLARKAEDFIAAKKQGKVAILIGVEGAKLLEGQVANLELFHKIGLRELQLRWAVPNQIVEKDKLTGFGIEVVRACQRLGIIVDVTHIPRPAFYETIELLEKPLIVSHGTAAGAGTDLDDRSLKALASRNGVLGIHFYSSYLGAKPTVKRVIDNVDYISQLVGIDTVGLGVDFFPTTGKWEEFQHAQGTKTLEWAVRDIGEMRRVTDALVAKNYSDADISKVLGGNFLRVCKEVFGD